MKVPSGLPILAPATFNDMNSLSESGDDYGSFVIFTPQESNRYSILSSDRLCMSQYDNINPVAKFRELRWKNEPYENCRINHTFKFLLDSDNQVVIKSDINQIDDNNRFHIKNSFYKMPFVGVVFDEDSSIHFIPFKCFCPRKRLVARRGGWVISDNVPSVFLTNISNEEIYLSFQKMKYKKFVLDCYLKENDRFRNGIFYLSIYKHY